MNRVASISRYCRTCAKLLVRRDNERPSLFLRRSHCNRSCGCVVGMKSRGMTRPKIEVPCVGCKAPLMRSVHIADARCPKCTKARQRKSENATNALNRELVRRYRMLMFTLGFEDFGELMAYLRTVPWTERTNQRDRRCFDLRGLREFTVMKSGAHALHLWWAR